ncbi:MAG: hypothetical protein QM775_09065 [Pirellulales bacterium]
MALTRRRFTFCMLFGSFGAASGTLSRCLAQAVGGKQPTMAEMAGGQLAKVVVFTMLGLKMAMVILPLLALDTFLNAFAEMLKLDEEQMAKLNAVRSKFYEEVLTISKTIILRPAGEQGSALANALEELAPRYREQVMAVLQPEQRRRFEQIELQLQGLNGLLREDVAKQLELTDEQRQEIQGSADRLREKFADLTESEKVPGPVALGRLVLARKLADTKALKLLSEEQRKKWDELTGKPIPLEKLLPWKTLLAKFGEKDKDE